MSPEDPSLQDTNMKPMKTQGASDAMQMAHYKSTIIIIIIIMNAWELLIFNECQAQWSSFDQKSCEDAFWDNATTSELSKVKHVITIFHGQLT